MGKGKRIDISGQRFGRLVALSRAPHPKGYGGRWLCQCDCGTLKAIYTTSLRSGMTRSCGCLAAERRAAVIGDLSSWFWDRVTVRGPSDCWEWTGATTEHGYGRVRTVKASAAQAHRVAWALHHGAEPDGLVLHHCDNRLCCNPAHLYVGTQAQNVSDMVLAGRHRNPYTGPMTLEEDLRTRGVR